MKKAHHQVLMGLVFLATGLVGVVAILHGLISCGVSGGQFFDYLYMQELLVWFVLFCAAYLWGLLSLLLIRTKEG